MSVNGFVLIDKETEWTSRDVCNKVGHILGSKKVGHIGTLDPFATGLMIVAIGEGTKCLPYIDDDRKTYIATLKLGEERSTGDVTGDVISQQDIPTLNAQMINDVLDSFIGEQEQIPPMSSAIHYKGQKLYSLFRQGIKVDVPPKHIIIYDIKLLSFTGDEVVFETVVSKGTYIRVLGEDIAKKLGTVGYLKTLRRTKINDISVDDALKINDVALNSVLELDKFLGHYVPLVFLNKDEENKAKHGMEITVHNNSDVVLIIDSNGQPVAFYGKIEKRKYSCLRGFHFEDN